MTQLPNEREWDTTALSELVSFTQFLGGFFDNVTKNIQLNSITESMEVLPISEMKNLNTPKYGTQIQNTSNESMSGLKTIQNSLINLLPGKDISDGERKSVSMNSLINIGHGSKHLNNFSRLTADSHSTYSDPGASVAFMVSMCGYDNNHTKSMESISGLENISNHPSSNESPPPSDPLFKSEWFLNTLCENLSKMYAIFLFVIGCVLYLTDILSENDAGLGEIFNVVLIIIKLLWLGYIHVDLCKYINSIATHFKKCNENNLEKNPDQLRSILDLQQQLGICLAEQDENFVQQYGFTSGKHGGSLYLKIGSIIFCIGYLIHTGLNFAEKIIMYTSEDPKCDCFQDIVLLGLQPIYAFYQLFFIFRYSNLIINTRKKLSRFAFMHCISSSLLLWVYTIIQETLQDINGHKVRHHKFSRDVHNYSLALMPDGTHEHSDNDDDYSLIRKFNSFSPFLYPFSIEYNILIVGFWILLLENIGRMDRQTHVPSVKMTKSNNVKGVTPTLNLYVDCNYSLRGMFAGLLMAVASAISIILLYIFSANEETKGNAMQVNCYSELIFLLIMIVAGIMSFLAIRQLDITKLTSSYIDDLLLYICLPFIFMYSVFSMIPAIKEEKNHFIVVSLAQVVQVVIQTALISDGLRRRANSRALSLKKPGRELITFMIVANLALWLLETFQIKFEDYKNFKYKFYGEATWTLLSHITLPVALFYRFHSSVCLVDIWKGGYEMDYQH